MSTSLEQIVQAINKNFPGQYLIPLPKAANFLGIAPKTIRNRRCAGFEMPGVVCKQGKDHRGNEYLISADALAALAAEQLGISTDTPTEAGAVKGKRGRGRPPKSAAATLAKGGVA